MSSGFNMTAIDVRASDDTVTAILNGTGSYGEPFVAIFSLYIDGDGMAHNLDLLSTREHMVDAVRHYEDGILIDDTHIPLAYTPEEIEVLLGE